MGVKTGASLLLHSLQSEKSTTILLWDKIHTKVQFGGGHTVFLTFSGMVWLPEGVC